MQGDEALAQTRLLQTINDGLRAEFGNRTVHDVVSGERDKIMELMRAEGERGRAARSASRCSTCG